MSVFLIKKANIPCIQEFIKLSCTEAILEILSIGIYILNLLPITP